MGYFSAYPRFINMYSNSDISVYFGMIIGHLCSYSSYSSNSTHHNKSSGSEPAKSNVIDAGMQKFQSTLLCDRISYQLHFLL
jgi:hypothetical protein